MPIIKEENTLFLTPYITSSKDVVVIRNHHTLEKYDFPDYTSHSVLRTFESSTTLDGYWYSNNVHVLATDDFKLILFKHDWTFIRSIQLETSGSIKDVYVEDIGNQQGWFGRSVDVSVYTVMSNVNDNDMHSITIFHNDKPINTFIHKMGLFANFDRDRLYIVTDMGHVSWSDLSSMHTFIPQTDVITIHELARIDVATVRFGKIWTIFCDEKNNCILSVYDMAGKLLNKRFEPNIPHADYSFHNDTIILTTTSKSMKQPIQYPKIVKYLFDALTIVDPYHDKFTIFIPFGDRKIEFEQASTYLHSPMCAFGSVVYLEDVETDSTIIHVSQIHV